jgi:hypothetical protein
VRHHPDRRREVGRLGVFHEKAARAEAQRVEEILVESERGEYDDAHASEVGVGGDLTGGFQPVKSRHADVHEDHVGPELSGQVHDAGPVRRLADDLDVVAGVEQRLEPARTRLWSSASRTRIIART